jgi:hypothetical protein
MTATEALLLTGGDVSRVRYLTRLLASRSPWQ